MYFQPRVIYRNPLENKDNSIIRYIGSRVLRNNKNFMCALTGQTGSGKSWAGVSIGEMYSKMFNIPFDPEVHVIFSLKQLLELITRKDLDKLIQFGSILVFDEPQIEANSRDWQGEVNKILNQLTSTFRNQRLIILFATPSLDFIDKQSRILFHGDFTVMGYDKNTKITSIKPRFLEYSKAKGDFYRKRLVVEYAVPNKQVHEVTKLNKWHISAPSQQAIDNYEGKKKTFTDNLNARLLKSIELREQQQQGKNKADDLFKIRDIYLEIGDDYMELCRRMPHLSPSTVEKLTQLVKRSFKTIRKAPVTTRLSTM